MVPPPPNLVLPYRAHNRQSEEPTHDSFQRIINYLTSRLECALLTFLAQPLELTDSSKHAWSLGVHTEMVREIGHSILSNILTLISFSAWLCLSSATPVEWDHSLSFPSSSAHLPIPCFCPMWENLCSLQRSRAYC